ncbi:S8 family serine peptidase [Teredinibacter waterburyi]|uniref:S8 family serine peptidase n=1 Tax=Teredinibacter waterburyi TaxID=1500538 RepID=UPI00165EE01F|nr:S8 family serine peptidase [Teredinibacter waterburyi]
MKHKRTGHWALLASSLVFAGSAQAQLVNSPNLLDPITEMAREIDDIGRDLGELSGATQDALDIAKAKAIAAAKLAATDPIANALGNPLAKLPQVLNIVDSFGNTQLVEVEVEDGWRAIAQEWLITLSDTQLITLRQTLAQTAVEILSQQRFAGLGLQVVRIRVPQSLDNRTALSALLPPTLGDQFDRNHSYGSQSANTEALPLHPIKAQLLDAGSSCLLPVKVGMVDTALQASHPAFSNAHIVTKSFLPADLSAPMSHGTAVAGLLVGQLDNAPSNGITALLPKAQLFAASAFYARSDYAQGATALSLIKALDWLAAERVQVINLSLAGPPNSLLAQAVGRVHALGIGMVSAVGNEGPASPPLYPAAYNEVIGVTAVDSNGAIYRWANQGKYVDFSALGVSVVTARVQTNQNTSLQGRQSGTSIAAPVVTARLACELFGKQQNLVGGWQALNASAEDLGEVGPDTVFGAGLLRRQIKTPL